MEKKLRNKRNNVFEKNTNDKTKKNKGIILIALVVTIVFLPILVGMSLMGMGENEIITQAQKAKTVTEKADVAEVNGISLNKTQIKLIVGGSETLVATKTEGTEGNITWSSSDESVATVNAVGKVTGEAIGTTTITAKGKLSNREVTGTCEVEVTQAGVQVTAEQIAANPKAYYGKKVENYTAGGATYRIFYVDAEDGPDGNGYFGDGKNTIYLKADYSNSNTYNLDDYPSSYDATNTKVRTMNPDWSEARGTSERSWNTNEKAAAYLCSPVDSTNYTDTAIIYPWKDYYMNNDKVNYVIGGPSIEMYVKSYNQAYAGETGSNIYTLGANYRATSYPGYIYTLNGVQSTISNSDYYTEMDSLDYSTKYNNMYCGRNGSQNEYWWLASPSARHSSRVCYVYEAYAALSSGYCHSTRAGVVPLVSLKSDFVVEILE